MSKIFIIPFHVKRLAQSIMPEGLSGAYVSCYAPAAEYIEATKKSLLRLSEDGLHPEEILQPIQEMDSDAWAAHIAATWAEQAESLPTQAEFNEVVLRDGIVYGPFSSYE